MSETCDNGNQKCTGNRLHYSNECFAVENKSWLTDKYPESLNFRPKLLRCTSVGLQSACQRLKKSQETYSDDRDIIYLEKKGGQADTFVRKRMIQEGWD